MEEELAETRSRSYRKICAELGERHLAVLGELAAHGEMTAQETAEALYADRIAGTADRNAAAPRLTELKGKGIVEVAGKRTCHVSGRKVGVFRIAADALPFVEERLS